MTKKKIKVEVQEVPEVKKVKKVKEVNEVQERVSNVTFHLDRDPNDPRNVVKPGHLPSLDD